MSSTCKSCLHWAALLSIVALVACPAPGPGTFFQREGRAFKTRLQVDAKGQMPSLADDQLAIGVIEDARGKRNLTYVPFALHLQQGRKVSFVSWDGPFTLTLKRSTDAERWPFQEREATLTSSGTPALQSVTVTAARDAAPGWYNFRVTLSIPDTPTRPGEKIQDLYCPSIIIDVAVPDDDAGVPRLDLDAGVPIGAPDAGY